MAPHADGGEDPQCMTQLREWLDRQPHLPSIPDKLLARMLHSCYGSVERTKLLVDSYLTITTHAPEVFGNRAALDHRYKSQINVLNLTVLTEHTKQGYTPILIRFQDTDASKFDFSAAVHTGMTAIAVQMEKDDRVPGYEIMFDFTGITMAHIIKMSPTPLKQLLIFVQNGLAVRLKGIHFINCVPIVQHLVSLMKPLMKKEFIEIFHVHTLDDMPMFYKTVVAKSVMPEEFGGSAGKCADLHADMRKLIESNIEYLQSLDKLIVDETKRPGKSKSSSEVFGIQGSFKKLDLD